MRVKCIKKNINKGFTLVELIVVLVLIAILSSLALFGGLAWQDWAKFNHEDTMAEEIFFAAQNQLSELDASGALENKINAPLLKTGENGYDSNIVLNSIIESVVYKREGDTEYTYDLNNIWNKTGSDTTSNANSESASVSKEKVLIRLTAKSGDYDDYLANSSSVTVGTRILFDIIASYVSDTGALNGAISLEFSPYTGQVFSVCYSDNVYGFVYGADQTVSGGKLISIMDRSKETRQQKMIGYFSVDELTLRNKGRSSSKAFLELEMKNSELLTMIVHDTATSAKDKLRVNDTLEFTVYNGSLNSELMKFSIVNSGLPQVSAGAYSTGLAEASSNPTAVNVEFLAGNYNGGMYSFRMPVWKSGDDIYIVLDAADVQAQTLAYNDCLLSFKDEKNEEAEAAFRNTYSFYRFGLGDVANYIYADVSVMREDGTRIDPIESGRMVKTSSGNTEFKSHTDIAESDRSLYGDSYPKGECIAFDSFLADSNSSDTYVVGIKNARHFYNMRYETEYKENRSDSKKNSKNVFTLENDISWKNFVDSKSKGEEGSNYFLNSYSKFGEKAGIDFDGQYYATESIGTNPTDTSKYPFPGFRNLDAADTFTQDYSFDDEKADASKNNYQISDLNISISANIVYGVYGKNIKDKCYRNELEDYSAVLGLTNELETYSKDKNNPIYKPNEARAGKMPLGLFAENLGEIKNITLNRHVVKGLEELSTPNGASEIVYTCMVGGFAGNNIGKISNLVLLDTNTVELVDGEGNKTKKSEKANVSHVSGRTDVGGIIGRESFVVSDSRITSEKITIDNMKNYATVSGMENVGGIVGRVYTHYVCGLNPEETADDYGASRDMSTIEKYKCYHDGYDITDSFKSLSGKNVGRVDKVEIKNCINRGKVSGDKLVYDGMVDSGKKNLKFCAFIGGIAGIVQDGLVYDDAFNSYSTIINIQAYKSFALGEGDYKCILVENCNSYVEYDVDNLDYFSNEEKNESLKYDNYVGGLVGYSRLAVIKNCNTSPDTDDDTSAAKEPFVFGRRYVGGICGCSDLTRFDIDSTIQNDDPNKKIYAATNYNNVIGRAFIGGIAGGNGIGEIKRQSLTFRNPSENRMLSPSQYGRGSSIDNGSNYVVFRDVCNSGVVLSLKSESLYITSDSTKSTEEFPTYEDSAELDLYADYAGSCGGIVGINRSVILNCDNFQSQDSKELAMRLITNDSGKNLYDSIDSSEIETIIDNSPFGGEFVGGLVGYCLECGRVNLKDKDYKSYIDAVVFGQDCIGGAVGCGGDSHNGTYDVFNTYPDKKYIATAGNLVEGLAVIGRDGVGGLLGKWSCAFVNKAVIDKPFIVKGRYAVGGVVGIRNKLDGSSATQAISCSIDIKSENGKKTSIKGIGYVGGLIGYSESNTIQMTHCFDNGESKDLSGVTVDADFFAGGIAGALVKKTTGNIGDSYLKQGISVGSDVTVTAKAFAGGIAGLFTNNSSGFITFCSVTKYGTSFKKNGTLYDLVARQLYNYDAGQYKDASSAYRYIVNGTNGDLNSNAIFLESDGDKISLDFNDYTTSGSTPKYSNLATVSAELSAGGLFGYVPEGINLDVKNFVNNGNIKTTSSLDCTSLDEIADDENVACSFLGGVIGRVPTKMSLIRCKNLVTGSYSETAGTYYSSPATCLGGLTEVNAGTIIGSKNGNGTYNYCENDTSYTYGYGGIAAFAGINGTLKNTNENPAEIAYCVNKGDISSTGTDNATYLAGIAAISCGSSAIEYCENKATITAASGKAAGVLCEARKGYSYLRNCTNGDPNIKSADSIKSITASDIAAGIIGRDIGTTAIKVYNCKNYDSINASGANGDAAGIMCTDSSISHTSMTNGCVIEKCENHGAVDAKNTAAGIYCKSDIGTVASYYIAIKDSVNTGVITVKTSTNAEGHLSENTAGIAYDTKEWGRIAMCRNYGTGLKYGITANNAYKIHYCFDATNAEEHIGNTYASAPATSKYANFYVGEKKPTYFKAEWFYGTYTAEGANVTTYTRYDGIMTQISNIFNDKNISSEVLEKDYYNYDGDSNCVHMDSGHNTIISGTKYYLTYKLTPYKNKTTETTADMDSISVYWHNYLGAKLLNKEYGWPITIWKGQWYDYPCSVNYRVLAYDTDDNYISSEIINTTYNGSYFVDKISLDSNGIKINGNMKNSYVSPGFQKDKVKSVYLIIDSSNQKMILDGREILLDDIISYLRWFGINSYSSEHVYIRSFRWNEGGELDEKDMLNYENANANNSIAVTINPNNDGLKPYCTSLVSSHLSESMFTMGPESSPKYQLLLNSYVTGISNLSNNTFKDTGYLTDYTPYIKDSKGKRLKMWSEIDTNYVAFINANFGNGLEGDLLENDEIIGDNIPDEPSNTDNASASDASTDSSINDEGMITDIDDAKQPDEFDIPDNATPSDAEMN